jgi:hypothetical protein
VSAGGGPGRPNCAPSRTISGFTPPSHGVRNGADAGGVGRHTPGPGGRVNGTDALRPSFARWLIRVSAASSPNAAPCRLAVPSGICASDVAYAVSSVARAEGT